jgi:hypothetical protein
MRTLPRACGLRAHLRGALAPEDDDRRTSSASSREQTPSNRVSASSLIFKLYAAVRASRRSVLNCMPKFVHLGRCTNFGKR